MVSFFRARHRVLSFSLCLFALGAVMANRTSIKFDTPNTNIEVEVTGVLEWLRAIIGETEYTDLAAEVYGVRPSCISELLREKKLTSHHLFS